MTKIQWKSIRSPGKGKAKRNPGKGKKGGKKGKEIHPGKGYGEPTTEHSRFDGECRNCGKYGHKASDCWYKQTNKSQGKGKGTGKSKSKVTEISESENSKQVEDWNPSSNTPAQQPNLSQVNTTGCADEGLWILSLENSKKRRYTVNWEDQSCSHPTENWKTGEHALMIDSGCFGHVCPLVCTAISNGEFYKRQRCGSEQRGTATLRTQNRVRARDDEQWKTNLDPDHI